MTTPDTSGRDFIEIEDLAAACHEANRRLQLALGEPASQPWMDCPEWFRLSVIAGVQQALAGATPEQLHEAWCADRVANGWVYGEQKDQEAKTHPCLVPYEQLSEADRAKDALFHAVVGALEPLLPPAELVKPACERQHVVTRQPAEDGSSVTMTLECGAIQGDDGAVAEHGDPVASRTFSADEPVDAVQEWLGGALQDHMRPTFTD